MVNKKTNRPEPGTLGSLLEFVKKSADKTVVESKKDSSPNLIILYQYVINFFENAVLIAKLSRTNANLDLDQFLTAYANLTEYSERINQLQKKVPTLINDWPKDYGITFSWLSGWSALDAAFKFGEMIKDAVVIARTISIGVESCNCFDSLKRRPKPDARIIKWYEQTIQELKERTLPSVDEWPMWKITRDSKSLLHKIYGEYTQACKVGYHGETIEIDLNKFNKTVKGSLDLFLELIDDRERLSVLCDKKNMAKTSQNP